MSHIYPYYVLADNQISRGRVFEFFIHNIDIQQGIWMMGTLIVIYDVIYGRNYCQQKLRMKTWPRATIISCIGIIRLTIYTNIVQSQPCNHTPTLKY